MVSVALTAGAVIARRVRRQFYFRFDQIRRALPGCNCGACGFAECTDYAVAVANGTADPMACVPGGPGTAHGIADVLGHTVSIGEPMMAVVHCNGGIDKAKRRARYEGIEDCRAALLIGNGTGVCIEGCLGLRSCVRACPFGALSITGDGLAVVDQERCNGCGVCLPACPRSLLSLIPDVHKIYCACNNHDYGAAVAEYCSVGCTACEACVAITPSGAVTMHDHLPHLNYGTPGENFLAAAYTCPSKCFIDLVKVRPRANIDTKCDGCGECLSVCPVAGAITGEREKRHVIQKDRCIGCGRCLSICHVRAISLWGGLGYGADY
jgi:Na+-translocating ferredoxin:NAD+ oxidoreductase RNF subunit RnfB